MASDGTLYLQIANSIARSISSGALRQNDRLPSLGDLARQRSVWLATATQAYRTLEDSRLIEGRPRSGYFVRARPAVVGEPGTSRPPRTSRLVDRSALVDQVMAMAQDPSIVSFGAACPTGDLFDEDGADVPNCAASSPRVTMPRPKRPARPRPTTCSPPEH